MWFRIELDKSGAILACTQVEMSEAGGKLVRYVEAETKTEACKGVKAWFADRKAKQERCRVAKQAERKQRGHCSRCDRKATHGPLCGIHHARLQENRRRFREGKTEPRKELTPREAREAYENNRIRMALPRVLREFDARGPEAFRAWLVSEISARAPSAFERRGPRAPAPAATQSAPE